MAHVGIAWAILGYFRLRRLHFSYTISRVSDWDGWNSRKRTGRVRAQPAPLLSDFINFEILVFITLPHWILRAILHRIANGFIALNAFFVHPH